MQSLGLDVKALDKDQNEIDLKSNFEEEEAIIPQPVSAADDDPSFMGTSTDYEGADRDMEDAGMSFKDGNPTDDDLLGDSISGSSHTSSYSDDDDLLGDDFSIGESFDDTDDDDLL